MQFTSPDLLLDQLVLQHPHELQVLEHALAYRLLRIHPVAAVEFVWYMGELEDLAVAQERLVVAMSLSAS